MYNNFVEIKIIIRTYNYYPHNPLEIKVLHYVHRVS